MKNTRFAYAVPAKPVLEMQAVTNSITKVNSEVWVAHIVLASRTLVERQTSSQWQGIAIVISTFNDICSDMILSTPNS